MDSENRKNEEDSEKQQNIEENPMTNEGQNKIEEDSQSSSSESSRSESKKRKHFQKSSSSASLSRSRSRSKSKSKSKSKASQPQEKSNKSKSRSKKSPSRSSRSASRENHPFEAKNYSPYNRNRGYDFDSGNTPWDRERRGPFSGRDRPYYRRRDDGRFNKYSKRHDDSRSRSSSGQGYRSRKNKSQKQIFVPLLDGPLVSYRIFMESQPDNVDRNKAEKFYEKYKKDWETKQMEIFFGEHKTEEWFVEKYDPILSERLREERRSEAQKNADRFFENYLNGVYDNLNLEIDEETLNTHLNKEVNFSDKNEENNLEEAFPGGSRNKFHKEITLDENVDIFGEPYFGFDPNCMTLFIKSVPKHISRWEIKDNLAKVPGFLSLSLSEPLKTHDFLRFGWVLFDSEENCNKGAYALNNLVIKDYAFTIVKSKGQKKPLKVATKLDNERAKTDIELCKELIECLDKEKKIEENKMLGSLADKSLLSQLDFLTLYLRKVHSYCFYCAAEYYDERMLSAKCGPSHLRLKIDPEVLNTVQDWHSQCNEIVRSRIKDKQGSFEAKDPSEMIETDLEEYLKKKIKKEVKDEKWPCLFCEKMFQGEQFVFKHFKNKHEEELAKERKEVLENKMLKAYISDKNKIKGGNFGTLGSSSFPMGAPSHHFPFRGGHFKKHQRKYFKDSREDRANFRKSGEEGQPYKKYTPREYKDLDDPNKSEEKSKGNFLINYNDI